MFSLSQNSLQIWSAKVGEIGLESEGFVKLQGWDLQLYNLQTFQPVAFLALLDLNF